MKFLVPNYSCLQNPWLVGYRPQIPILSVLCPQLNLLTPPKKIPGYATGSNWYAMPKLTVGLTPICTVRKQDKTGGYSAGFYCVPFFWGQPPQDMLKYRHTLLLPLLSTHRLDLPHSASLHMDLQNIKQQMSEHMQVPAYVCSRCD